MGQIDVIMDSISTRLVSSENQVIEMEDMSITLSKVTSSDLNEMVVGEGSAQFKMPANTSLSAVGDITAKVITKLPQTSAANDPAIVTFFLKSYNHEA